jgi:hypothetical protein
LAKLADPAESRAERVFPAFGDTRSTSPGSKDAVGPGVGRAKERIDG